LVDGGAIGARAVTPDDLLEIVRPRCRARTMFAVGASLGMAVGVVVGSVVAMRLGEEAAGVVRNWFGRMSGRDNRVNFELLLQ
jgi:uncharacterized membrane protein